MRKHPFVTMITTAVAVSLLGCAAMEQPKPRAIQPGDLKTLAGVWDGYVIGPGGSSERGELTINPDGTYGARMGAFSSTGVLRVVDGMLVAESKTTTGGAATGPRQSTMMLGEQGGTLVLSGRGRGDAGPFSFELKKRK
ncbi:MAG TPA: hypothetical protein VLG10_18150 [Methylomirabilota bacterium]|nr:hypothetical protein [Methylomirabilota bacterium]